MVTFNKTAGTLDSFGVDYTFTEFGDIEYESWVKAFKSIGFKRISREKVQKLMSFDDPNELQNDNTYNYSSHVSPDINFGIHDIEGGTLLVFKVHRGGDIRGNYTDAFYMWNPESKDNIIHELFSVIQPEIDFSIEVDGERVVDGILMSGGDVEFMENEIDVSRDQIWEWMEESGNQRTKVITL